MTLKPSINAKKAKARADKYFSEYIRLRDKDKPCITCGQYKDEKDCGHFISRRYEATRYHDMNSHGQCIRCNRFEFGNVYDHAKAIQRLYGESVPDNLLRMSKMACRRSRFDYDYIAQTFYDKIKSYE